MIALTQSSVAEAEETAVRAVDDRVDDVSQGTRAHFALQTNMSHLITKIKRAASAPSAESRPVFFAKQKLLPPPCGCVVMLPEMSKYE